MVEIWDAYDRQFNKIENVRLIRELREETGIESSNLKEITRWRNC